MPLTNLEIFYQNSFKIDCLTFKLAIDEIDLDVLDVFLDKNIVTWFFKENNLYLYYLTLFIVELVNHFN